MGLVKVWHQNKHVRKHSLNKQNGIALVWHEVITHFK